MRQTYIVTYDIRDPRRLRQVFRVMKGFGAHIQLSVFRCDLDATSLVELQGRLREILQHDVDQVLIIDVGPSDGRAATSIRALGKAYAPPPGIALVV